MTKKLILDLDTGIDDTLALAYVLGSPEVELIGITGTYGNVTMETGLANDLALLAMFGREDIPVFRGVPHPSDAEDFAVPAGSGLFHGANGTGNVSIPATPTREVSSTCAVDFIIESVRAYGDDLVVVPTGPSTNLDAAFAKAPDIIEKIHVVMMGGALTQPGNLSPFMEANISMDPKASNRVFATTADITMVGLDATMQTLMTREDTAALRATGTTVGRFLADMTDYYIDIHDQTARTAQSSCNLHDPLAAAVAIDPTLVGCFPINLMVDTEGPGIGRTIGDPARLREETKRTKVAMTVEAERFEATFRERLMAVALATA